MEHRCHRHIDVVAMEAAVARRNAIFDQTSQRMEHQLAVAEIDALRSARGSGRMENRRAGVLVEIREREILRAERQERLIFALDREIGLRRLGPVVHEHVILDRLPGGPQLLHQRQEVGVEQHRRRAAVDDRVGDVLGDRLTLTVCMTAPIIGTAK